MLESLKFTILSKYFVSYQEFLRAQSSAMWPRPAAVCTLWPMLIVVYGKGGKIWLYVRYCPVTFLACGIDCDVMAVWQTQEGLKITCIIWIQWSTERFVACSYLIVNYLSFLSVMTIYVIKTKLINRSLYLFIYLFTSTTSTTECYKYYKHIMQDPGLMDLLRSQ